VRRVVALLSCRHVANEAHQMARCRAACCRDLRLSLGSNGKIGYLYIHVYIYVYISQVTGRQRAA
jgi:hypothetical protein